jgi:cytochrome b subunit of formate dehydrogenase
LPVTVSAAWAHLILWIPNFLFQAIWLASTKRGRQNVRDLSPGFSDLRDLYQTVLLFLGFSRNRPSFGRYGFAEKFEFWALVWGTVVMTLTGLLLAYVGWTLGHAPKWIVDASELIHKWEAILAVGAIGIWHIYHVVWKPGVYPGNRAWLTGEISFEQLVMEHPLEYARAMGWLPRPETQTEASPETPAEPPSNKEGDVD